LHHCLLHKHLHCYPLLHHLHHLHCQHCLIHKHHHPLLSLFIRNKKNHSHSQLIQGH
jgi:hypothetical protein